MEVLARPSCFAEKLLANADRGRDASANARDLIDLAFMAAHWPGEDLRAGMATAQSAYGDAVRRELDAVLSSMNDADYRQTLSGRVVGVGHRCAQPRFASLAAALARLRQ